MSSMKDKLHTGELYVCTDQEILNEQFKCLEKHHQVRKNKIIIISIMFPSSFKSEYQFIIIIIEHQLLRYNIFVYNFE